ncbi:MAG: hypothetical protein ACOH1Y_11975 [Propionicimonas sp.]
MSLVHRAVVPAIAMILLAALTGCAHTGALGSVVSTSSGASTSSASAALPNDTAAPTSPPVSRSSVPAVPAAPASTASLLAPVADPLGGVAQDLKGVDNAIAQAGSDVAAGDSAAQQSNEP